MKKVLIIKNKKSLGGLTTWIKYLEEGFSRKNLDITIVRPNLSIFFKLKNIDLVHIYEFSIFAFLLTAIAKIKKIPVLATVHADFFTSLTLSDPVKKNIAVAATSYCLKNATRITVPTDYLKNILSEKNLGLQVKIVKIPNCLDLKYISTIKPFVDKSKEIKIVQITDFRYLHKAKGVVDAVSAIKIFTKEKIKLEIIGGRGFFSYFNNKYSSKNIIFIGSVPHDTALKYLKSADIVIHPTYLDNSPMAILEAFACAKPVICYDTGGIKETARGCAIFCKPEDLAREIRNLVSNKKKRCEMAKVSKARSLDYSNKIISKKFERLYNCLIDG